MSRVRLPCVAYVQIYQDIHTQCALSWEKVVSEWQSVIAVSLKVSSGVRLFKWANCTSARKTQDKHTVPDVCGHGFILLSHSGNVFTRIGIYLPKLGKKNNFFRVLS